MISNKKVVAKPATSTSATSIARSVLANITNNKGILPSALTTKTSARLKKAPSAKTSVQKSLDLIDNKTVQKIDKNEMVRQSAPTSSCTPVKSQDPISGKNMGVLNIINWAKSPGVDTYYSGQPKHMTEIIKEVCIFFSKIQKILFQHSSSFSQIVTNMKENESKYILPANYPKNADFPNGALVTDYLREKIVDWMLNFSYRCDFKTPTMFLAVNYFDRLMNSRKITTDRDLFLFGAVSVWIASKYEGSSFFFNSSLLLGQLTNSILLFGHNHRNPPTFGKSS